MLEGNVTAIFIGYSFIIYLKLLHKIEVEVENSKVQFYLENWSQLCCKPAQLNTCSQEMHYFFLTSLFLAYLESDSAPSIAPYSSVKTNCEYSP